MSNPPGAFDAGFLGALADEEAEDLRLRGTRRVFKRGATIVQEGHASDRVVAILAGRVKVSYFTEEGKEVVLAIREPGDLVGDLSAVDGQPCSATATVVDEVQGLVLTAAQFRDFLAANPRAALLLLETISNRLREADRKRIEFGAQDTQGRVANVLLELADRFGEASGGGVTISLPLSQEELAGWVGASREAVAKALQALRRRGHIETGRKQIRILNPDALRRRAS